MFTDIKPSLWYIDDLRSPKQMETTDRSIANHQAQFADSGLPPFEHFIGTTATLQIFRVTS